MACAVVDHIMPAGPRGQSDPSFACAMPRTMSQEEGAHRLACEDPRQRIHLRSRCNDPRATRLSHQPRGRELAPHATGPERTTARARQGQHLIVNLRYDRYQLVTVW